VLDGEVFLLLCILASTLAAHGRDRIPSDFPSLCSFVRSLSLVRERDRRASAKTELEWMFWFMCFVQGAKSFQRNDELHSCVPKST